MFGRLAIFALSLWTSGPAFAAEYALGAGDSVLVHVHGQEELTREHDIGPVCLIEVGLIGAVSVCGRSADEVAAEIRTRLSDGYLVQPQVTVEVKTYGSQRIQVMGEVARPGELVLSGPTTLVEAIIKAGDRKSLNVVEAELVRSGEPPKLYNLETLPSEAPVYLQPGDIVVLKQARFVYVTGGVRTDGPVTFRQGLTVTQALATAGGPGDYAQLRRAYIVRADGEKVRINVKKILAGRSADMSLEPDDQLIIGGS